MKGGIIFLNKQFIKTQAIIIAEWTRCENTLGLVSSPFPIFTIEIKISLWYISVLWIMYMYMHPIFNHNFRKTILLQVTNIYKTNAWKETNGKQN